MYRVYKILERCHGRRPAKGTEAGTPLERRLHGADTQGNGNVPSTAIKDDSAFGCEEASEDPTGRSEPGAGPPAALIFLGLPEALKTTKRLCSDTL